MYVYIYIWTLILLFVCLFLGSSLPNMKIERPEIMWVVLYWRGSWAPLHTPLCVCIYAFYIYVRHTHVSHAHAGRRMCAEDYMTDMHIPHVSQWECLCVCTVIPSNPYKNSLQFLIYEQDDKHTQTKTKQCTKVSFSSELCSWCTGWFLFYFFLSSARLDTQYWLK